MYFSIPLAQHVMEQLFKPSVENTFLIMNIRPFYSGSVSEKIKLKNHYPHSFSTPVVKGFKNHARSLASCKTANQG